MSKAVKCDRCLRCFDPAGTFGNMLRFKNPTVYSSVDMRGGNPWTSAPLMTDRAVDDVVDLCPQCTEEFTMFLTSVTPIRKNYTSVSEKDGV